MKKKNNKIMFIAISILLVLTLIAVVNGTINRNNSIGGNEKEEQLVNYQTPEIVNGYQQVELKFINYEYKLSPETLLVDVPVRMEVDLDTVYGCMRAIMIPAFSVRQYVNEQNNIIEFTPTKTGVFNILCTMNMGRGKFRVVEG
jgi:uncharacterized protein